MKMVLFNQIWLEETNKNVSPDSWAFDVIDDIKTFGSIYLSQLNEWYTSFPFPSKGKKKHLKNALESLSNEDHRGAVNELCWFRFLKNLNLTIKPLPEKKTKSPDFKVISSDGQVFFHEVSTLNTSKIDKLVHANGEGISINHGNEILRIVRKIVDDKAEQLKFGFKNKSGSVFVIFDYSTHSGFGTQRPFALSKDLFQAYDGINAIPSYVSAIFYIERYVKNGKCMINSNQSAVFHNPRGSYQLNRDLFVMLRQYELCNYRVIEPNYTDLAIL